MEGIRHNIWRCYHENTPKLKPFGGGTHAGSVSVLYVKGAFPLWLGLRVMIDIVDQPLLSVEYLSILPGPPFHTATG